LSIAFPIGSQRIVTWQSIALAVLAGLLAAAIGVLAPLWGARLRTHGPSRLSRSPVEGSGDAFAGGSRSGDGGFPEERSRDPLPGGSRSGEGRSPEQRSRDPLPGGSRSGEGRSPEQRSRDPFPGGSRSGDGRSPGERSRDPLPGGSRSLRGGARAAGLACLLVTTVIVIAAPASSLIAIVTLLLAALLLLPSLVDAGVSLFARLQRPLNSPAAALALVELRSPAARTRMLAIAATAAIAVIGGAMLQGSRSNLQDGLSESFHTISSAAELWVSPATGNNLFATVAFPEIPLAPLRRLPGVRAVSVYHASFLNVGDRRVWVEARPATAPPPLSAIQLTEGNLALANARLRGSGWVVLSSALAAEYHVAIGQRFTLPTAHPVTLRVAALSTDLGWPAGAVIMSPADYEAAWGGGEPSAYSVMLDAGASPERVATEVRHTLARTGYTGLEVQTERRHEQLELASGHQGLERLTEMALLLLLAGVLASASTMGATVWQRRRALARLKVQGLGRRLLWRSLVWESSVVLGLGCLIGVAFGIYGQLLVSHALLIVTGFPMVISLALPTALESFAAVALAAGAIVALSGYRAAAVPAQA
jgi:putative ABC transport system permease protein